MPELPEVETVVRGLRQHIVGRTIVEVRPIWQGCVESPALPQFVSCLIGRRVIAVSRRGKYILVHLDNNTFLSIHLRMTGRVFVLPPQADITRHTRLILVLDDGQELHFLDQRKFGRVALWQADALAALNAKLGPEPLDTLTVDDLQRALARRKTSIKSALLDQSLIAGLGNIYADEALFAAGIHPQRPANSLAQEEIVRLHAAIRSVLMGAVERQGTTLSDEQFRQPDGRAGRNQERLNVFRRTGRPCPRCGSPIKRLRLGGRSTHFCPCCQH